ncbi:Callose synthase [Artemisia annua]|uniref:Callose synthase n=1 Tax=Artemisia annua TaxID=35608 RepID=A0A2U1LT22_ARTAN|nr:Callose synthase [Artemisia annua]
MASTSGTKDAVGPPRSLSRRSMTRSSTMFDPNTDQIDSELVPSSLSSTAPILRVANEIENDNPRVAYLCKHKSNIREAVKESGIDQVEDSNSGNEEVIAEGLEKEVGQVNDEDFPPSSESTKEEQIQGKGTNEVEMVTNGNQDASDRSVFQETK